MMWKKLNLGLVIVPILIFSLGFVTLYSVSPSRAESQLLFFLVGILVYLSFSFLDYSVVSRAWKIFYFVNLFLLFLLFILGRTAFGSTRWLTILGFSIQPSEFAKFTLVLSLASIISHKPNTVHNLKGLFKLSFLFIPFFAAVLIQPDLGTSLILFATLIGVLVFMGMNKLIVFGGFFFLGLISTPLWNLLKDYQKERILVFLNPQLDSLGAGYNVVQSMIAIGSGGVSGKGFGHGSQSHLEFLPAYWTDFIFASFAEEWGFLGVFILLILFFMLFGSILITINRAKDLSGVAIGSGVLILFLTQFFINIGMNLGLMPVTGIPLPLMTYGGSALITNMALLGLIQSVWVHS